MYILSINLQLDGKSNFRMRYKITLSLLYEFTEDEFLIKVSNQQVTQIFFL